MRVLVFAVAILTATVSVASAQTADATLLARTKALDAAIATKDAAKVAAFYADDAMEFANGAEPVKGRAAIQKDFADMLSKGLADMTFTVMEVRTGGDIGYRVGRFRFPATSKGRESASGEPLLTILFHAGVL